jgi:hypothetical protein
MMNVVASLRGGVLPFAVRHAYPDSADADAGTCIVSTLKSKLARKVQLPLWLVGTTMHCPMVSTLQSAPSVETIDQSEGGGGGGGGDGVGGGGDGGGGDGALMISAFTPRKVKLRRSVALSPSEVAMDAGVAVLK